MRRCLVVAAGLVTGLLAPASNAQNCAPFTDVAASDPFCTNIQWMHNRAITLGCTSTAYCPTQFVRRDQMAAFMNRLANFTFQQGGNAFGATAVIGTTDQRPFEILVENARAMRIDRTMLGTLDSVNVTGGASSNRIGVVCGSFICSALDPVVGATIAGGGSGTGSSQNANVVTDSFGAIGGGRGNTVGNLDADQGNAPLGTIGGGYANTVRAEAGTVGGGMFNWVSGTFAVVPGGLGNAAIGDHSFAAGLQAEANADGCFVWSDTTASGTACHVPNQFVARASGGFQLLTNPSMTSGCSIAAGGGSWSCSSARDLKDDFAAMDPVDVLERVASLPISTWRYRDEASRARHLGPTAEDFREAFGLGDSSREIGLIDGQGVALAAIQGLNAKLEARIAEQAREIAAQRDAIDELRRAVAALRAVPR